MRQGEPSQYDSSFQMKTFKIWQTLHYYTIIFQEFLLTTQLGWCSHITIYIISQARMYCGAITVFIQAT